MTDETFDAAWLALREPVDHRARSRALSLQFLAACADTCPIADLGAGTGSNMRYLQALAKGRRTWRLIDRDAGLLARAGAAGADVDIVCADLAEIGKPALKGVGAVTAAALLDLVSEAWLGALAEACARQSMPALFALNVDGRVGFDPVDPDDAFVLGLFRRDQDRDKGLGAALGTSAPDRARHLFAASGFTVQTARSDWFLTGDDGGMPTHYLQGVARAAAARTAGSDRSRVEAWLERRVAAARDRALTITVGHEDVLAIPS